MLKLNLWKDDITSNEWGNKRYTIEAGGLCNVEMVFVRPDKIFLMSSNVEEIASF